jgi:hypothetical protein
VTTSGPCGEFRLTPLWRQLTINFSSVYSLNLPTPYSCTYS